MESPRQTPPVGGDPATRRVGEVSAWASVVLGCLYGPAIVAGIIAPDGAAKTALLAAAEVLTLVTAIPLVGVSAALYLCAPARRRIWGLAGFGFMLLLAGTTMSVHFIELTVARHLAASPLTGPMFGWDWPAVAYGLDVVAWDLFLGIALICAALTLPGRTARWACRLLLASGCLSLAGLVGPALDAMGLRAIGIVGYAIVLPVAAVLLARLLHRTRATD